ncbi:hypothetical protein [Thermofilum sp.]|jgi:hypothetical protein|uniref:hypothetical protein n=1 Tax=Thermofilum sp. TaxID=1961369 RepID=UPI0025845311|nr:hypothetical protein [Thermofilum sp.]
MSPKSMKLHDMLDVIFGKKRPWDEYRSEELVYGVCLASSIDEERCKEIYDDVHDTMFGNVVEVDPKIRENAVRGVKEVMERFEVRGSCLVEKGVKIEDPSVCEGDINERLTVIGSRMQFSVDSSFHNMAIRFNGTCIVGKGEEMPLKPWNLRKLHSSRLGLIEYDEASAVFSVGRCNINDLPNLVKEAEELDYGDVYYAARATTTEDEVLFK